MSEMSLDRHIVQNLRIAYDRKAQERENTPISPWKMRERQRFLSLMVNEGKTTLLEIGAGTGKDSKYFQDNGLDVVCIDLSPENVRFCRQKGLIAHVMDVLHLEFPQASFDGAYSMNCLLHVPSTDLPRALSAVRDILKPGGLFYLGQYGGVEHEGVPTGGGYDPPRFYSYHTDEEIKRVASQFFRLFCFERVDTGSRDAKRDHYQSLMLHRPPEESQQDPSS